MHRAALRVERATQMSGCRSGHFLPTNLHGLTYCRLGGGTMSDPIGGGACASRGRGGVGAALAVAIALGACSGDPPKADDVGNIETVTAALSRFVDDNSTGPMHVTVKVCTTDTA